MAEQQDRKKVLGQKFRKQYRTQNRKLALSILLAILAYVAIAVMVLLEIMPETHNITVGEAAEETIRAIAEVEDFARNETAKKEARDAVADVYDVDKDKNKATVEWFDTTVFGGLSAAVDYGYNTVRKGKENTGEYVTQYDSVMQEKYRKNELSFLKDSSDMLGDNAMNVSGKVIAVFDSNPDALESLKEWFMPKIENWLNEGIRQSNYEERVEFITSQIIGFSDTENSDPKLNKILADIVADKLEINSNYNEAATEAARKAAEDAVEKITISAGEVIVEKDAIVTQNQYDMMKKLGMLEDGGIAYPIVTGSAILVLILVLLVVFYIWVFERKTAMQPKKILLLVILVMVDILICLLLKSGGWVQMMNTAICTVIIAVLFNEQLALVINAVISVVLALFVSSDTGLFSVDAVSLMLSSTLGGIAGIYMCKKVRTTSSRAKMLIPGAVAGVVAMITAFSVMWAAGRNLEVSAKNALYGLAGGIAASIFSAGSLSIWESMFGLVTQSKLLELSNSSSDLLRKISIEIPGTYQHSTTVAEMAENAAKDIGANAMLARTGALYHDIGKLRCPECYTENQTAESKNFHNTLSPQESAKMIFSHITEGVQIAKANKLPAEIIDIIMQHHGTSAVLYFYNKAKAIDPETRFDDFRYPGPNPQTKEAGIVMLADCVEASVRSMDEKTVENIKGQIERMFKARMDEGELDECALTLKDINTLKNSFTATLSAVYHTRIKYDNQEKKSDDRNN